MHRPASQRPDISGYDLAAIAICIAVSYILAPPSYRWLGVAIGAAAGVMLGRWWRSEPPPHPELEGAAAQARDRILNDIVYLVLVILSAVMLWKAVHTWFVRPEQRLTAIAGILFFVTTTAVLVTLWQRERRLRAGRQPRVERILFGAFGLV